MSQITSVSMFEAQRPALVALAYRMLGERALAEDVVQEAWLRWRRVEAEDLDQPAAWLRTVTTRLAIDALRRARSRREAYIGPWLPEPLMEDPASDFTARLETVQQAELALVWVMEFLTPDERAAFVLHDTFDEPYSAIASVLDKTEAALPQTGQPGAREDRRRTHADRRLARGGDGVAGQADAGERSG